LLSVLIQVEDVAPHWTLDQAAMENGGKNGNRGQSTFRVDSGMNKSVWEGVEGCSFNWKRGHDNC
jgi:hypothetical protein